MTAVDLLLSLTRRFLLRFATVNATEIWRACGGDVSKRPALWLEQQDAKELLGELSKETVASDYSFVRSVEGRNGGTWMIRERLSCGVG